PIPPAPRGARISYGPSRVPAESAILLARILARRLSVWVRHRVARGLRLSVDLAVAVALDFQVSDQGMEARLRAHGRQERVGLEDAVTGQAVARGLRQEVERGIRVSDQGGDARHVVLRVVVVAEGNRLDGKLDETLAGLEPDGLLDLAARRGGVSSPSCDQALQRVIAGISLERESPLLRRLDGAFQVIEMEPAKRGLVAAPDRGRLQRGHRDLQRLAVAALEIPGEAEVHLRLRVFRVDGERLAGVRGRLLQHRDVKEQ